MSKIKLQLDICKAILSVLPTRLFYESKDFNDFVSILKNEYGVYLSSFPSFVVSYINAHFEGNKHYLDLLEEEMERENKEQAGG